MEKAYNQSGEDAQYKFWEDSGAMRADATTSKPTFTIALPPPNVTGKLHLGHAAMLAIQDILIRFKAMTGHEVLWIPGTDHAAIATENVVLKHHKLKSREEVSREEFMVLAKDFAEKSHDTIINQTKKMGAWLDWSREVYTFDEKRNKAVVELFTRLWQDDLIERGTRLVNWSPKAKSVLSDDEVEWEERVEVLYHIQCGEFVIATVRPETKCADSAVVVHPDDPKYKHLIGTEFEFETYAGKRKFHVIGDEVIDPEFGTGAMTISPAHDANDYAIAKKHGLPLTQKIDFEGKMTEVAGELKGLSVKKARAESVRIMKEKGLIVKEEVYPHRVPLCYRTGCVVEPMISPQWYVRVEKEFTDKHTGEKTTLKKITQDAIRKNHSKIIPERFNKIYFQWIDNLRDWCISRQIWWGHRLPVWEKSGEFKVSKECPGDGWIQSTDTLDTWFSSALWPASPLGWPNQSSEDLKKFYPTQVLETGHDILFFWVARMLMMNRYILGEYPFETVYLHGLVTDEKGKKMSKSKGNGIDPLDVISKFGADAVRLSLVVGTTPGQNIPIGEEKIKGYRNFVNKLWNATRFVKYQIDNAEGEIVETLEPMTLAERWILSRFSSVSQNVGDLLEKYQISHAGSAIYHFVWDEFCAWYIEASKVAPNPGFALGLIKEILKLAHPLVPFVTEQAWEGLTGQKEMLIKADFPTIKYDKPGEVELFKTMQEIVEFIRKIRAEKTVNPKEKIDLVVNFCEKSTLWQEKGVIETLGNVRVMNNEEMPEGAVLGVVSGHKLGIIVPVDEEKEAKRIAKEKEKLTKQIAGLKGRLSNKAYTDKAPKHLVDQTKSELENAIAKLAALMKS